MRGQNSTANGNVLLFGTRKATTLDDSTEKIRARMRKLIHEKYKQAGFPLPENVKSFDVNNIGLQDFVKVKLKEVAADFKADAEALEAQEYVDKYNAVQELLDLGEKWMTAQIIGFVEPKNGIETRTPLLGKDSITTFYPIELA